MGHMSSVYDTSIIPFALSKISLFQDCPLLLSPISKSCYSLSEGNVCESVSGYAVGLIVFALFKNCDVYFYSH